MLIHRLISAVQSRSRRNNRHRLQLAEAAARASYPAVWQRVEGRTSVMSQAEARGYIRSISVRSTNRELRQLLIGYPRISETEFSTILDRAVEHVVRMIASQSTTRTATHAWQTRQAA
jgi:hypothetical protein